MILFTVSVYTVVYKGIAYRYITPLHGRKNVAKFLGIDKKFIYRGASPVLPALPLNKEKLA
jgi:hypothetical protein